MQRNCLILGCGRSGTSLAAGLLSKSGYFMGDTIDAAGRPTLGNPKGQFEDAEVNKINEEILGPPVYAYRHSLYNQLVRPRRRGYVKVQYGQRWLAALPPSAEMVATPELRERIAALTAREPYCFKDPRLSYTLGVWRPYLRDAVFVCVFRHPAVTATSIVTECSKAAYLRNLPMDVRWAQTVWREMYTRILEVHLPAGGEWIFAHYDQIMDGSKLSEIESALNVHVDRSFADPALKRSAASGDAPGGALAIYERLCALAEYTL